jgi:hypothetical protein
MALVKSSGTFDSLILKKSKGPTLFQLFLARTRPLEQVVFNLSRYFWCDKLFYYDMSHYDET